MASTRPLGSKVIQPVIMDVCYYNSNSLSPGSFFFETNGVMEQSTSTLSTGNEWMNEVGYDTKGGYPYGGLIQGIYIMTNPTLSSANFSNIHYYRTNVLTPGAM